METQVQYEDPFSSSISLESADSLYQSLLPELEFHDDQYFLSSSPSPTEKPSPSSNFHKKLNHNAYERDRRKKLNDLYSSLCMLLPEPDRSKKMSIPMTVSRVIKYIPELQKQVVKLTKRKEQILLRGSGWLEGIIKDQQIDYAPIISATCLTNKEIMVNVCVSDKMSNNVLLSKYLKVFEGEGLKLINASTSSTQTDKTFYNLHFEVQGRGTEGNLFCDHLTKAVKEKTRN
ncbi:hypothetical protein LUZ60_003665 [Juncus effusus]|nr:hypothetical protein LUZ60_003665 [Juncus effusus]